MRSLANYPRTYTLSMSAVVDFDETDPSSPVPTTVYLQGGERLPDAVALGLANAALRSWGGYRYEAVVNLELEVENGDLMYGVVDHEAPRPIVPVTVAEARKVLRKDGVLAKDVAVRFNLEGVLVLTPLAPTRAKAQDMARRVAQLLANEWYEVELKAGATVVKVTGREDR